MNSEERRASIIAAATRLFSEKGFRGTTTREVAAAVGVTEPVIYEHFNTKRDLYTAIIDEAMKHGQPVMTAFRDRFRTISDDRGFFTELAHLVCSWHRNDAQFVRLLLFSGLEKHELSEIFHSRVKTVFTASITEYIERRVKEGVFRCVDPLIAGQAFAGMVSSYAQSTFTFESPSPFPEDKVIATMVDIFLEGLCRREA